MNQFGSIRVSTSRSVFTAKLLVIGLAIVVILSFLLQLSKGKSFSALDVKQPICGEWLFVNSSETNVDMSSTYFGAVSALSEDDVWFAGEQRNWLGQSRLAFAHWNGSYLAASIAPKLDADSITIKGLSMSVHDDAWAVGHRQLGGQSHPLIVHWDGKTWKVATIPESMSKVLNNRDEAVGSASKQLELRSLAIASPNDVWVVGTYPEEGVYKTLTLHWDGNTWEIEASPNVGTSDNQLDAVVSLSERDVWAFGWFQKVGSTDPWDRESLTLHWAGTRWTVVDGAQGGISNVSATSVSRTKDIWTVGHPGFDTSQLGSASRSENSSQWNTQSFPHLNQPSLSSVAAVSFTNVWAVGTLWGDYPPQIEPRQVGSRALVLHWDGNAWSKIPAPNPSYIQSLDSVSAASENEIWVVGSSFDDEDGPGRALIAHFLSCPASRR